MSDLRERIKVAVNGESENNGSAPESLMHGENPWSTWNWSEKTGETGDHNASFAEDVTQEMVENYGGEDCGSEYYTVWKFTSGEETVYARFDGWYQSYNGADYSDWKFVEPVVKTVTVYE